MRVRATIKQLMDEYGDDIKVVFKHLVVHPQSATTPALAACAADRQGKFSEMQDLIFEKGTKKRDLGPKKMNELAEELGLDMSRFAADMKGPCQKVIERDRKQMQKFGVHGTPGFFINGRHLRGAVPLPQFKKLIDEELKKANERIAKGTPVERYYSEWVMKRGEKKL